MYFTNVGPEFDLAELEKLLEVCEGVESYEVAEGVEKRYGLATFDSAENRRNSSMKIREAPGRTKVKLKMELPASYREKEQQQPQDSSSTPPPPPAPLGNQPAPPPAQQPTRVPQEVVDPRRTAKPAGQVRLSGFVHSPEQIVIKRELTSDKRELKSTGQVFAVAPTVYESSSASSQSPKQPVIDPAVFREKATLPLGKEVVVTLTHVEEGEGGLFHVLRRDARALRELLGTFARDPLPSADAKEGDRVFLRGKETRRCSLVEKSGDGGKAMRLKDLDSGETFAAEDPTIFEVPAEVKDLPPLAVPVTLLEGGAASSREAVVERLRRVCQTPEVVGATVRCTAKRVPDGLPCQVQVQPLLGSDSPERRAPPRRSAGNVAKFERARGSASLRLGRRTNPMSKFGRVGESEEGGWRSSPRKDSSTGAFSDDGGSRQEYSVPKVLVPPYPPPPLPKTVPTTTTANPTSMPSSASKQENHPSSPLTLNPREVQVEKGSLRFAAGTGMKSIEVVI